MLEEVEQSGHAEKWVSDALDRAERLMGFGHRIYRAKDPRAGVLRRTASELGSPRFEAAEALEKAALAELHARRPGSCAGDERRVLVSCDSRSSRSPAGSLHTDVHLRARGRLVGAHPQAEARGEADPSHG